MLLNSICQYYANDVRFPEMRAGYQLNPLFRRKLQTIDFDALLKCGIIYCVRNPVKDIQSLLRRLDGSPADAIESETLECKPWDADPRRFKDQLRDLREAVVCLANARGGAIVLGIQDRKRSRKEAISGVGSLQVDTLRKSIYDGTDPHILVDVEELTEPEGRLLVVHVPRGLGAHTTTEGVGKIRVGKDCQPLTGSMLARLMAASVELDRTALPAD